MAALNLTNAVVGRDGPRELYQISALAKSGAISALRLAAKARPVAPPDQLPRTAGACYATTMRIRKALLALVSGIAIVVLIVAIWAFAPRQPKFQMVQDGPLGWGPCLNAEAARFVDSPYGKIAELNIEQVASMVATYCEQKHAPELKDQDEFVRKAVHDRLSHDAAILIKQYRE
jgi:hypothetical protein